jgi:hypothetical protein
MVITSFPANLIFAHIVAAPSQGLRPGFRNATEAVAFAMDFLEP